MSNLMRMMAAICLLAVAAPAAAQQTSGNILGRVVDSQGAAVAGAMVAARNADTGFTRETTTDDNGVYSLLALPVGPYTVTAERAGMARFDRDNITVNIARTTDLDIVLRLANLTETVVVTAQIPLLSTTASSVGQVVEADRIERLPLNGRQFANLAATVPGVGLGFHSDPTKLGQYTPQIDGGNGRNINYLVDGGRNTDDTVGGLLQLFPLEAIQEFNVITQRPSAEYGRNGAAVLNVITRSGTNALRGSWFTLLRDDAMNAQTLSERINGIDKQDYRRYQFGGSVGGPLVLDRAHYFAAYERTQQDTRQVVNTLGLFPAEDGVFDVAFRQNLFTTKLTIVPTASQYVALRYARDDNSQPAGAGLRNARSSWATSSNTYDSINLNHNWTLGSRLNELVFQYMRFVNDIPQVNDLPSLFFPGNVRAGGSPIAPQGTRQTTWELRDSLSWVLSGGGGFGHQIKTGFSWVHEPTLMVTFQQGTSGIFTIGSLDVNGPVTSVLVIGEDNTQLNFPLDSFGVFVQDDWLVSSRLTLNLGLRWDYTSGMPIDQANNPNFVALQAAGRAGRFTGTPFDAFGQETQGDKDNIQPRLGFVYDLRGNGRNLIRGGWGIYTDFGYTNANVLTAAIDAQGGGGPVFIASSPAGLVRSDGTLFRASDPLSTIAHLNVIPPGFRSLAGEVVSPRLEQPYTRQLTLGWARELTPTTALTVDYVKVQGRDLNMRLRPNVLVNGVRYLAGVGISPNSSGFRIAVSRGRSEYDALIVGLRRRFAAGLDFNLGYTLAKATSDVGTASDEIVQNLVQDITQPLSDVQMGPSTRTDSRHQVTFSAIVEAPLGIVVAPIFMYRSALPTHSFEGRDLNADSQNNDRTALAYRFTGLEDNGRATFEEMGACETVNCSRRAPFSQLNLRVSRAFALGGAARIEAIAEVFNLFNARNPFIPLSTQRLSSSTGAPLASFMQPESYAGDTGQPEQRVGQIGFRITF